MTPKRICIQDLNEAIALANQLKLDITQGKRKQAINRIADILFILGRTLTCINQLELSETGRAKAAPAATQSTRRISDTPAKNKAECIRLADLAIDNFKRAKRFVQLGRYEDAENTIAAALTGRILRCVNHLRT